MKNILILFVFGVFLACSPKNHKNQEEASAEKVEQPAKKKRPVAIENGKFFEKEGRKMLYGGEQDNQHFDITDYALKDEQFHYGIGRERFPALLEPAFISIAEADSLWEDDSRFLVAYAGNEVKAYAVKDLTRHEVVNDVLDGEPIMAAYCILADLGAVYKRQYGEQELTFALSGYTYFDEKVWDGLDGFVLWDRETESLWWPLIDKAVSGPLKDVKLLKLEDAKWEDVNWKKVKEKFPNAQVLKSGQDYERPKSWEKIQDVSTIRKHFISKN